MLIFGPFRLDSSNQQLWSGSELVGLQPKTFSVLCYLAERPQRLITKRELLEALWRDVYVGEAVLKTHLKEIRQALGDSVKTPRFIQTVHGRGYRFVAPIEPDPAAPSHRAQPPASVVVARQPQLGRLAEYLEAARRGERGVVFVTGEPGIGKTSLLNAFCAPLSGAGDVWLARGQCIEQYGSGATYLPVLEALSSLCRGPAGPTVIEVLRRQAPTWLIQMPELLDERSRAALEKTSAVATPERALRELAEAMAVLSQIRPIVWLLEDLQWADYSTLDLVSYLARRSEAACLLLIGTYRSIEIGLSDHPLRAIVQSLQLHEQCEEIVLRHLSEADVVEYLDARFPDHRLPPALAGILQRRTAGNPLFIARVVDDWIKQGQMTRASGTWLLNAALDVVTQSVPASIIAMIERETERLTEFERRVLEVASVVGNEFSTASVAAVLAEDDVRVDELCSRWARHGRFLEAGRAERDGADLGNYQFIHALYHQVIYTAIGQARRARLHQSIGEHAAALQGGQPQGAVLASHFERAHDVPRALHYRRVAGDQALGRSAYRQAIGHFRAMLELCKRLPPAESQRSELEIQVALGVPLAMTLGYAAPEVEKCHVRAARLCEEIGGAPSFPVMSGLATFHLMRGRNRESARVGEDFLVLALREQDTAAELEASVAVGTTCFIMGDFRRAAEQLQRAVVLYDPQRHRAHRFVYQQDAYVSAQTYLAWALWALGYPDQALARVTLASQAARDVAEPYNMAVAQFNLGLIHLWRREADAARRCAEALLELCEEHGFSFLLAAGMELRGAALVQQGDVKAGLALLRQGWAAHQATGAELGGTHWRATLADACLRAGLFEDAGATLVHALRVSREGLDLCWEPELYRLYGELCQQAPEQAPPLPELTASAKGGRQPEQAFLRALELARGMQARSLELRAANGLARLWAREGKAEQGRTLLADLYRQFEEGRDTPDLRDARALLSE